MASARMKLNHPVVAQSTAVTQTLFFVPFVNFVMNKKKCKNSIKKMQTYFKIRFGFDLVKKVKHESVEY